MSEFTLDDITAAADRKFGPMVIPDVPGGPVTLLNPLRMSKDKRRELVRLQSNQDQGTDEEQLDASLDNLKQMVLLVAKTKAEGERLLKALGDDQGKLAALLNEYGDRSKLGEA